MNGVTYCGAGADCLHAWTNGATGTRMGRIISELSALRVVFEPATTGGIRLERPPARVCSPSCAAVLAKWWRWQVEDLREQVARGNR